jgi:hypothetical protein
VSGAERQKRRRLRVREGTAVWAIEVHEADTAEALADAGVIAIEQTADRRACIDALTRLIRTWVKGEKKP